jgi:hypothetical protein
MPPDRFANGQTLAGFSEIAFVELWMEPIRAAASCAQRITISG